MGVSKNGRGPSNALVHGTYMRIDCKNQAYPGTSVFRQTQKSKKRALAVPCWQCTWPSLRRAASKAYHTLDTAQRKSEVVGGMKPSRYASQYIPKPVYDILFSSHQLKHIKTIEKHDRPDFSWKNAVYCKSDCHPNCTNQWTGWCWRHMARAKLIGKNK